MSEAKSAISNQDYANALALVKELEKERENSGCNISEVKYVGTEVKSNTTKNSIGIVDMGIGLAISGGILFLVLHYFPLQFLYVYLASLAIVVVFYVLKGLWKFPILLIPILLILILALGYFFTKAFIGTLFVGLGICFLLTRPYWVGLALAVAGAIILLHKSC